MRSCVPRLTAHTHTHFRAFFCPEMCFKWMKYLKHHSYHSIPFIRGYFERFGKYVLLPKVKRYFFITYVFWGFKNKIISLPRIKKNTGAIRFALRSQFQWYKKHFWPKNGKRGLARQQGDVHFSKDHRHPLPTFHSPAMACADQINKKKHEKDIFSWRNHLPKLSLFIITVPARLKLTSGRFSTTKNITSRMEPHQHHLEFGVCCACQFYEFPTLVNRTKTLRRLSMPAKRQKRHTRVWSRQREQS